MASDQAPLYGKFGIKLKSALDLAPVIRKLGYKQRVGLQAAVAIVLGQRLPKSKSYIWPTAAGGSSMLQEL